MQRTADPAPAGAAGAQTALGGINLKWIHTLLLGIFCETARGTPLISVRSVTQETRLPSTAIPLESLQIREPLEAAEALELSEETSLNPKATVGF